MPWVVMVSPPRAVAGKVVRLVQHPRESWSYLLQGDDDKVGD